MQKPVQTLLVRSVLLSLIGLSMASAAVAAPSATEVLKAYDRDHGLCVLIGCGSKESPALAAELASSAELVVHGIALDDASLARARDAIGAAGVAGVAAVEKISLKPLPYRDNLVSVMVVENLEAAKAAGFSMEEGMRVVAPGGKLCVFTGDKLEVTAGEWPKAMDEWTHEAHGPDGNCVSKDELVKFPLGFRWNTGLPFNLQHRDQTANAWSSTRGMALAGGRCFTLSNSVLENIGPTYQSQRGVDQYVTARDAFNGLFLWRRKIGGLYYGGLFYPNRAPFVAIGDRVYTASEEGKLLALDAATGEVDLTFDTTHVPGVILVDRGVVVAATWKDGSQVGGLRGVDRRRMTFSLAEGTVEAFDPTNGLRLWSLDTLATSMRSADGVVYLLDRKGADRVEELGQKKRRGEDEEIPLRPEQAVVAVNLKSGKVLWTVGPDVLGTDDPLRMDAAGFGVVTVSHNNGAKTTALAASDGKKLFQVAANSYTAFYDGAIHLGPHQYDPKTGERTERSAFSLGKTICTPRYFVNDIIVSNRGCGYRVDGKPASYRGARGGCLFASIPAYGVFFTPQNWCRCAPSQIQGFVAFGPIAHELTVEEMESAPPVEKGPAYGQIANQKSPIENQPGWFMYRHDAERTGRATSDAPSELEVLWQTTLCQPAPDGRVGMNWRECLTDPLTAPTVADGVMIVAAADRHQVIALDVVSGRELWRATVGGRIDTPPTIYNGACLFGAHDGYVYALSSEDGRLGWRMRAAPLEERMVSYGQVESPWPVIGTVLVADGIAYASAGRTQGSDGGIVVRAFEPATGKILWSKAIADIKDGRSMRLNDLMLQVDDSIQLMVTRMEPRTGDMKANPTQEFQKLPRDKREGKSAGEITPTIGLEGFVCGNWMRLGNRKSVSMGFGNVQGDVASWGKEIVCTCTNGRSICAFHRDGVGPLGEKLDPAATMWGKNLPEGYQATSIIVCPNAVVIGGGVYEEGAKGFIQVLSVEKGETVAERTFPAPVTYNGLALADGRVHATFADGSAACLGSRSR